MRYKGCMCCACHHTKLLSQKAFAEESSDRAATCKFAKANWTPQFGAQQSLLHPKSLAPGSTVSEDDTIQISLDLDCHVKVPAYGSVIFTSGDGAAMAFLLKSDSKGAGRLKTRVPATDLKTQGPDHEVTAYVGDSRMQPLQWSLGSVSVMQRSGSEKVAPAKPSKRTLQYERKPEIVHQHRPEHQQPPALVPLAASAFVLAPLAAWLALLGKLPLNVKALPSGTARLSAGAFHALIAMALAFGTYYWMRMRLTDVLLPLAGLALATVLVGHRALSTLADRRIGRDTKATKKD